MQRVASTRIHPNARCKTGKSQGVQKKGRGKREEEEGSGKGRKGEREKKGETCVTRMQSLTSTVKHKQHEQKCGLSQVSVCNIST